MRRLPVLDFQCRVILNTSLIFMRVNKIEAMYKRKQQPIAVKASKRQSGKKKICDERKHLPHTLKACRLLQTVSA